MVIIKRAASAFAVLAILALAANYLPPPMSTAASIVLGGFVLLLLLPLLLVVIGIISIFISDGDDGGWFGGILDAWFMWTLLDWLGYALKWPWLVVKWLFARLRPDSGEKQKRVEEPPFNREA